ncbi:MAG TPA: hypothetical protein VGM25_15935 [Caulobacteraceae bacterium]|jgi:hypothetical protein
MNTVARVTTLAALAGLIAAAPAARADDDPATIVSELVVAAKVKPTEVSGLEVRAKPAPKATGLSGVEVSPEKKCLEPRSPPDPDVPAPKLVSTYPAKGEVVRPGLLVVRLTFDLPMACRGSLRTLGPILNPCMTGNAETWILSYDRLNLRVLCRVAPGQRYGLLVNSRGGQAFQGLGGGKPPASELAFQTSQEAPVSTVEEAVALDQRPAATPANPVAAD